ncbi:MAG: hypothetical protein ACLRSD_00005 [Oscillibacter sp.]
MEKMDFPEGTKPRRGSSSILCEPDRLGALRPCWATKYRKSKMYYLQKDGIFLCSPLYFSPSIRFGLHHSTAFFDVSSPVIAQWRSEQEVNGGYAI